MGDRAIIILHDAADFSPAIYVHWLGHAVPDLLKEHVEYMGARLTDVSYSAARLVGQIHTKHAGVTGLGIFAATGFDPKTKTGFESHGDAGVICLNVATGEVSAYDGYLAGEWPSVSAFAADKSEVV